VAPRRSQVMIGVRMVGFSSWRGIMRCALRAERWAMLTAQMTYRNP
jgi:hypothetical protein